MAELSNKDLLGELGVEVISKKKPAYSAREQRIIAGFEEILVFVGKNGKAPEHGEDRDIFERLYATRLDQICANEEYRELVQDIDTAGLLNQTNAIAKPIDEISNEALLAELGVEAPKEDDLTYLRHVKPRAEVRAAEEIGSRISCEGFETFRPIFDAVQIELKSGMRITRPFKDNADIRQGDLFILSGQKVYVAEMGEEFITGYDRKDSRLRVIYDNGTESDILLRSLQRALNKDEHGRRIIDVSHGPLFANESNDQDSASGTIYVLRSLSELAEIQKNKTIIHKIGVTGSSVKKRIANAKLDPTYLMADVEIVATYELYNINRAKLEHLLHTFFEHARLDIQIKDRFGNPVTPREWFLVPLAAIDQAVEKIKDESIGQYYYDSASASLMAFSKG